MKISSTNHYPLSTRTAFLLTLIASAIILAPTIFWPFDYDQGTFAYGGWAVLHGQRPYLDFWDIKPPNIFYTYAAAFALFGNSVRAIRIFDYLNALLTISLLFTLATRLWKNAPWRNLAAVITSLAFIVQYYIFGHWDTAQTETYSLPLLIGAMLLVIPQKESKLSMRSVCAGVLIGISFYYKFPNALFLGLIATAIWLCFKNECHSERSKSSRSEALRSEESVTSSTNSLRSFATFLLPPVERTSLRMTVGLNQSFLKSIAWLFTGFIAAVGLQSLYLAVNSELLPLWHITTSETASYVSSNYSGSFGFIQNLRTSSQALDLSWIIIGIVGWSYWLIARRHEEKDAHPILQSFILLTLDCLIALVAVQLQNKGYKYHYAILLPWADLIIGAGFAHCVCALSKFIRLPRWSIAVGVAVLILTSNYWITSSFPLQDRTKELMSIANGKEPANGYIGTDSISDYVIQHTNPDEKIFIFGFQPYVYWKTGRAPATKFLNTIHFKPNTVNKADRDELVTSLLRNPPELFLVEMGDRYTSQGNTNDDSRTTILLRYPELEQLLLHKYWSQDTLQNTIIYHKR